jgi:type I restriction enzyme S subunit
MDLPKRVVVKKNDILICVSNGSKRLIGKCALIDSMTEGKAFGAFMSIYRSKFNRYVFYVFQSDVIQKQINEVLGATINQITNKDLFNFQIPFPPLLEQKSIADILSDTDELIQVLERRIAKKRLIKQGVMRKLLTPKEGWETKKLGDLVHSFQNGYGFSAKGYIKNGTPIVTMAQIGLDGSFQYNPNKVNRWIQTDFDSLKSFHLINGDVIIAMTDVTPQKNLIGRMTIVRTDKTLLLNQRVGHLRIDNTKVNPIVLCTLSNMNNWRYYSGDGRFGFVGNLNWKTFSRKGINIGNSRKLYRRCNCETINVYP